MAKFNQKNHSKTVAGLVAVCVLVSIFMPFGEIKAVQPSLSISKSVDKRFVFPGEEIVYTLNYQNNGPGEATGVVIKDPFTNLNQHRLSFISATPTPNSGNDTWIIDTLNYGQSGQIIIRAKISSSIPSGSLEIKNRASIDSNETSLKYSNYASAFISIRANLKIDKFVRNVSKTSSFSRLATAEPGDTIEFLIELHSDASRNLEKVKVWDELPSHLTYISGSTKVNDSSFGDGITNNGINIGGLNAGQEKLIKFKAKLDPESDFSSGITVLNNYAYAEADNLYSIYDSAGIKVETERESTTGGTGGIIVSGLTSSVLNINKLARNVTKKSTFWTSIIYAEPGDEIEFLIEIKAPRNKDIDSVRVSDKLPSKLTYISDSTTIDGYYEPDAITSSDKNVYIGDVYSYLTRKIKFKVKVAPANKFNLYPISLVNTAYAWGSDGNKVDDFAKIIVREPTTPSVKGAMISPGQPLSISKLGRNLSQGRTNWLSSFSANPGEEVEFSIQIVNTGDNDLGNVKVWDILPASLLVIKNSTTVDGVSWGGDVADSGLSLGTLYKSQAKTIKFRARIDSADKFSTGSTTLINTAYVSADNASQYSDQSSVLVTKAGEVKGAAVVKGAADVKVGTNLVILIFLIIISGFAAFLIYCRLREDKILEILNNGKGTRFYKSLIKFYFRLKFFFRLKAMRFKKVYW